MVLAKEEEVRLAAEVRERVEDAKKDGEEKEEEEKEGGGIEALLTNILEGANQQQ